jgi:hypothetical protein
MYRRTPTYHEMSPTMATALMHSILEFKNTGLIMSKWAVAMVSNENKSLMKQKFVKTHTIHPYDTPALYSWFTNTPSIKIICS